MKKIKQYKIPERAKYGFKKTEAEEKKLERRRIRWRKQGIEVLTTHHDVYIEDPKKLLEILISEVVGNSIFYKKGTYKKRSNYEYALTPKTKEFLTKHYIPYVHREYVELINTLLKKQLGEKHE